MHLYPTRATFHVALAGAAMVAVGVAGRVAPVAAWGGAIILAVAVGRAGALMTVTRLRGSGFEMVWHTQKRVLRTTRGAAVHLEAELRNRGIDDARGVTLRAVASSLLDVSVSPAAVDLPRLQGATDSSASSAATPASAPLVRRLAAAASRRAARRSISIARAWALAAAWAHRA